MKTNPDFYFVDYRKITDLDETGFNFVHGRVDFAECEKFINEPHWKGYVGWRDITGVAPYFEFAGPSSVFVIFPVRKWFHYPLLLRDPFIDFEFKLKKWGWFTQDRS